MNWIMAGWSRHLRMADLLEQLIEMECADALLDSGVSVPLKRWKLPWLKRPLAWLRHW